MNARQKAKYYKQKYEQLAGLNVPTLYVEQKKIDTLKFRKLYPSELVIDDDSFMDIIKRDIAKAIVSQMDKYVELKVSYDQYMNMCNVDGRIGVVSKC